MVPTHEAVTALPAVLNVQSLLDFIAVLFGVVAIYSLIRLNRKLGGKLSAAIRFFNFGMAANVLAVVWSTFWGHLYMIAGVSFDFHHLLMSVGMIFFILSTNKLSGLVVN
ncbi:MAG: hypothetical protein AAB649_02205 [Patescibacteria group bacterium]